MTDATAPPGEPPGDHGRRPPPTIDLTATEVASEAAEPAPTLGSTATASPSAARSSVNPSASESIDAPPPWDERPPAAGSAGPSAGDVSSRAARPRLLGPVLAASALSVALTLGVLALAGMFRPGDSNTVALETRMARIEQQVRDLAERSAPVTVDPKVVDEVSQRVARLETILAMPKAAVTDSALANRLVTLEGALKAQDERIGVLNRRNDEIASAAEDARTRAAAATSALTELRTVQQATPATVQRPELEALTGRIAALEQSAKAMQSQIGARINEGDRSLRMLVIANALSTAVDRGTPFAAELDAAKAVAPDAKALTPLDRFAPAGVPRTDALAREFAGLVPALAKAMGAPSHESILGRLKANAEKIVRVRRANDAGGDDPNAVLERIEASVNGGDLTGALSEIAKLPAAARDVAAAWVAKVEAGNAAIEASRRFNSAALAALRKPL